MLPECVSASKGKVVPIPNDRWQKGLEVKTCTSVNILYIISIPQTISEDIAD